jgi:hypothetical protein
VYGLLDDVVDAVVVRGRGVDAQRCVVVPLRSCGVRCGYGVPLLDGVVDAVG